jgi:uncharacterized membrane protein YphA (DoxX/SURF4 family)
MLRVSPLVLRLGVAAALALYGVQQVGGMVGGDADQQAVVDDAGVSVTADWGAVLGVGALGVAGLLTLGLFTRLATLGVLGSVVYWAKTGMVERGGETAELAAAGPSIGPAELAMLLLAAACVSLLVSGCGCLGLDRRLFGRKKNAEPAPL